MKEIIINCKNKTKTEKNFKRPVDLRKEKFKFINQNSEKGTVVILKFDNICF